MALNMAAFGHMHTGRRSVSGGCLWAVVLFAVHVCAIFPGNAASASSDHVEASHIIVVDAVHRGRQQRVVRREHKHIGDNAADVLEMQVAAHGHISARKSSMHAGRRVVRHRRTGSGSSFSLWGNVSGLAGKLCAETGKEKYQKHTMDEQASSLNACMDHCETTDWCSTMSFHGDSEALTPDNVCVVVAYPCNAIDGTMSQIPNATDMSWITMNYTYWPEVKDMEGKYCENAGGVHYQRKQNVASLENCMTECETWPWCTTVSYEQSTNNCDLVSLCKPATIPPGSLGFDVFQKGIHEPPKDDADED